LDFAVKLTVLGATGSIGVSTLDVVAQHPDRFEVVALTGNQQIDLLAAQCAQFKPKFAVVGDANGAAKLEAALRAQSIKTEVSYGPSALEAVAALTETDAVMAAIVGAAGLNPTLAAARAGKRVLLANKEALVMAGKVFMDVVRQSGALLLPIDSEHNAIFQALPQDYRANPAARGIKRILLTASGGPFRTRAVSDLANVTPEQAVAHPNWTMGRKISVDSATMMNKGLEVIEAHWLFGVPAEQIEVVIHPQSVIHSMVDYVDGSVLAQLGNPDMRTPIANALAWPDRITSGVASLDLCSIGRLDFEPVDLERFPCVALAYRALTEGNNRAAVLNAANEIAVGAFLERRLSFMDIPTVIGATLDTIPSEPALDLEAVLAADESARVIAERECMRLAL
jgi:1-deoxy-D-xylulose-5-phosphate reductoisomerase